MRCLKIKKSVLIVAPTQSCVTNLRPPPPCRYCASATAPPDTSPLTEPAAANKNGNGVVDNEMKAKNEERLKRMVENIKLKRVPLSNVVQDSASQKRDQKWTGNETFINHARLHAKREAKNVSKAFNVKGKQLKKIESELAELCEIALGVEKQQQSGDSHLRSNITELSSAEETPSDECEAAAIVLSGEEDKISDESYQHLSVSIAAKSKSPTETVTVGVANMLQESKKIDNISLLDILYSNKNQISAEATSKKRVVNADLSNESEVGRRSEKKTKKKKRSSSKNSAIESNQLGRGGSHEEKHHSRETAAETASQVTDRMTRLLEAAENKPNNEAAGSKSDCAPSMKDLLQSLPKVEPKKLNEGVSKLQQSRHRYLDYDAANESDVSYDGAYEDGGSNGLFYREAVNYNERLQHRVQTSHVAFGKTRLNVFDSKFAESINADYSNTTSSISAWKILMQKDTSMLFENPPRNGFDEMIKLTEQGKLWKFPIDNEQGFEEEEDVPFYNHIFLEKLCKDFPKNDRIQTFMQVVCIGLSKNHRLSYAKKVSHIEMLKQYFEERLELLQSSSAFEEQLTS